MPTLSSAPPLFDAKALPFSPPKPAPRALWKPKTSVQPADEFVARQAHVSPVAAALLRLRGYESAAAIEAFLDPSPSLLRDPALLPDIELAVARLVEALQRHQKILIFGDYDADGVTSTALLVRCLRLLRADVHWRLPERDEGYGLSVKVIQEAKNQGFDLIMSADCGIRDIEPALEARKLGLDLIITDHHEPSVELPDCIAVVNPKRADSRYGFGGLSGCGVAFKVMQALLLAHKPDALDSFSEKFIDLVALSTIADCVPLCDENRYLTAAGLKSLYSTRKKGLRALIEAAGPKDGEKRRDKGFFVGRDVSWGLAPRLNAAGRLASPTIALELLLCDDEIQCYDLAQQLNSINAQRRSDQDIALKSAMQMVEKQARLDRDVLLVAAHEGWHRGIVGLIAGKLVEKYHRPAFAFNIHDGHAHGSGRSIGDFNLHDLLEATRPHYTRGGGHAAACGLTLPEAKIDDFRAAALEFADKHLKIADLKPIVLPDCEVEAAHLTPQLVEELALLEPCGTGNEEPKFLLRGAKVESTRTLSAGKHLEMTLRGNGKRLRALWWQNGEKLGDFRVGDSIELVFVPKINDYMGKNEVELTLDAARVMI